MFNMGFSEILLICAVLIIVVGPERLPTLMKTVGKTIRTVRQASREIQQTVGLDELLREDITRPLPPPKPRLPPTATVSRNDELKPAAPAAALPSTIATTTTTTTSASAGGAQGVLSGAGSSQPGALAQPAVVTAAEQDDLGQSSTANLEAQVAEQADIEEGLAPAPVEPPAVAQAVAAPAQPDVPPRTPWLAEREGMSIGERMLQLHTPKPAPAPPAPAAPQESSAASPAPRPGDSAMISGATSGVTSGEPAAEPGGNTGGHAGGDKGAG
jgi:sec-independent protein translocase protein TatB